MNISADGKQKTRFPKCPTGIQGLDEITGGGLPRGRPTLVCGGAGCGKTLLGIEFLVRGALEYGEPGVLMTFEESAADVTQNVASLGWDLDALAAQKKLTLDYVRIERSEIEETGEYNLDGLFIRLGLAIDAIGARRVVLDTIEALFGGFTRTSILRAELRRLLQWLKERGVTAILTGEPGENSLTRHGLEEYVSDCVIILDHQLREQIATRHLRVMKYRGSRHGTNRYPFLIDEQGISVMPITSLDLHHSAPTERISSGVPRLDTMLGGQGYYRGSSVLVSGTAGTGKTSLAAHFADAACRRGERALYFAFEEGVNQIVRNMRSIGVDLQPWLDSGLLQIRSGRPSLYGLEMHLAIMHRAVNEYRPHVIVLDPITNLISVGTNYEVKSALARLIDFFKSAGITALFTDLSQAGGALESTEAGISSIMDTWILLRDIEHNGERNRGLYVLKSRGMAHSNQVREFLLSDAGIDLLDVYTGPEGVLTGSARYAQEAREQANALLHRQEIERKQRAVERKRQTLEAQIAALHAEFEAEAEELELIIEQERMQEGVVGTDRREMARLRHADRPRKETSDVIPATRRDKE